MAEDEILLDALKSSEANNSELREVIKSIKSENVDLKISKDKLQRELNYIWFRDRWAFRLAMGIGIASICGFGSFMIPYCTEQAKQNQIAQEKAKPTGEFYLTKQNCGYEVWHNIEDGEDVRMSYCLNRDDALKEAESLTEDFKKVKIK